MSREAFEEWASVRGFPLQCGHNYDVYFSAATERMWDAWQAAEAQYAPLIAALKKVASQECLSHSEGDAAELAAKFLRILSDSQEEHNS